MARDEARFRILASELTAAIGATYASLDLRRADLNPHDPIEQACAEWAGTRVFRFSTPFAHWKAVLGTLTRLQTLWHLRPARHFTQTRPVGRVLRDFEWSVTNRDLDSARACIHELEDAGALDAHNYVFLEIRALDALQQFEDLLELDGLAAAIQMRRPWPVTEAILQAVFEDSFAQLSPAQGVAAFQASGGQTLANLLMSGNRPTRPSSAIMISLDAANQEPANTQRIREIRNLTWEASVDDYLGSLLALLSEQEVLTPEGTVSVPDDLALLFRTGQYLDALRLAERLPPGRRRAESLLAAAFELDTQEAAAQAVAAFDSLDPIPREEMLKERIIRTYVATLRPRSVRLPSSWLDWYQRLDEDSSLSTLDRLDQAINEWGTEDQIPSQSVAEGIAAEILRSRAPEAADRVADSMPRMVRFLSNTDIDYHFEQPLLAASFDVLTMGTELREPELTAISSVLARLLALGEAAPTYAERCSVLQEVWNVVESPRRTDWALNLMADLHYNACPDTEARLRLNTTIFRSLVVFRESLTDTSEHLATLLSIQAFSEPEQWWPGRLVQSAEPDDWRTALAGKTVGIHTLMESSARAARDLLVDGGSGITVVLNHDQVATAALDNLADASDVLVVSWGCAKHSATERLKARRSSSRPLLWAPGTGASGILAALREYAEADAFAAA
jgi:hypothetical protein